MPVRRGISSPVPGAEHLNIVVQAFGGWSNILHSQWKLVHLGDGCHDFIILLDGDGAYDYDRSPGLVEKDIVRPFLERLRRDRIEFKVLDRYGVENYFPRHAFETVMKHDLRAHFPLDPRKPVKHQIPGYHKSMNVDLAKLTTLADLDGTDLRDFLERAAQLAGD